MALLCCALAALTMCCARRSRRAAALAEFTRPPEFDLSTARAPEAESAEPPASESPVCSPGRRGPEAAHGAGPSERAAAVRREAGDPPAPASGLAQRLIHDLRASGDALLLRARAGRASEKRRAYAPGPESPFDVAGGATSVGSDEWEDWRRQLRPRGLSAGPVAPGPCAGDHPADAGAVVRAPAPAVPRPGHPTVSAGGAPRGTAPGPAVSGELSQALELRFGPGPCPAPPGGPEGVGAAERAVRGSRSACGTAAQAGAAGPVRAPAMSRTAEVSYADVAVPRPDLRSWLQRPGPGPRDAAGPGRRLAVADAAQCAPALHRSDPSPMPRTGPRAPGDGAVAGPPSPPPPPIGDGLVPQAAEDGAVAPAAPAPPSPVPSGDCLPLTRAPPSGTRARRPESEGRAVPGSPGPVPLPPPAQPHGAQGQAVVGTSGTDPPPTPPAPNASPRRCPATRPKPMAHPNPLRGRSRNDRLRPSPPPAPADADADAAPDSTRRRGHDPGSGDERAPSPAPHGSPGSSPNPMSSPSPGHPRYGDSDWSPRSSPSPREARGGAGDPDPRPAPSPPRRRRTVQFAPGVGASPPRRPSPQRWGTDHCGAVPGRSAPGQPPGVCAASPTGRPGAGASAGAARGRRRPGARGLPRRGPGAGCGAGLGPAAGRPGGPDEAAAAPPDRAFGRGVTRATRRPQGHSPGSATPGGDAGTPTLPPPALPAIRTPPADASGDGTAAQAVRAGVDCPGPAPPRAAVPPAAAPAPAPAPGADDIAQAIRPTQLRFDDDPDPGPARAARGSRGGSPRPDGPPPGPPSPSDPRDNAPGLDRARPPAAGTPPADAPTALSCPWSIRDAAGASVGGTGTCGGGGSAPVGPPDGTPEGPGDSAPEGLRQSSGSGSGTPQTTPDPKRPRSERASPKSKGRPHPTAPCNGTPPPGSPDRPPQSRLRTPTKGARPSKRAAKTAAPEKPAAQARPGTSPAAARAPAPGPTGPRSAAQLRATPSDAAALRSPPQPLRSPGRRRPPARLGPLTTSMTSLAGLTHGRATHEPLALTRGPPAGPPGPASPPAPLGPSRPSASGSPCGPLPASPPQCPRARAVPPQSPSPRPGPLARGPKLPSAPVACAPTASGASPKGHAPEPRLPFSDLTNAPGAHPRDSLTARPPTPGKARQSTGRISP